MDNAATNIGTNVVTTMHRSGYELYGKAMIATFLEHWPANTRLTIYAEDFRIAEKSDRLEVLDLHTTCPELVSFKKTNQEGWQNGFTGSSDSKEAAVKLTNEYNYKYDAVKFANKVFAYCAHAHRTKDRYLVWLDADTVTTNKVPPDFIASLGDAFLLYLGRRYRHSECGFLRFDMQHSNALEFFRVMRNMYDTGEIYTLNEWHDSFVFDAVRSVLAASGTISAESISGYEPRRRPFNHSRLGEYMDHLKGVRKATAASTTSDRGRGILPRKLARKFWLTSDR